ncbi:hypothetical protein CWE04_04950 [Thomasclavelia cocleata]|uniref:Uncharacterized protein n=1 Tax=Thomasclavelia cocleata TaxID=69824 RepID=A0A1I0CLT7_9FIRM|nr:hypothetical protein [Thomasclavelia cocleata]PJN81117.1 hypothetical protein CWE04_04950 [Thomasclavelia cocleata]SET20641.1 hypothetical protein SAMN04489758_103120 [Thomasclavelia cocleata]
MKVVNVKFRHGIDRPIRSGQPVYSFMCPIDTIEAGDYVLTEVAIKKGKNKNDFFQVARVEKVMEVTDYREKVSEDGTDPWSYVFCKIGVADFERRVEQVKKMKKRTRNRNWRINGRWKELAKKLKNTKETSNKN